MNARIASRNIKCRKPLDLTEPITSMDCFTHESTLFNQSSEPFANIGLSNMWDDKSIKIKIEYFQQNLELVNIMDKILEK